MGSGYGCAKRTAGCLLPVSQQDKMPSLEQGVDKNIGEQLKRPHPLPEGTGKPESNLWSPGPNKSSSSSSSEEGGLKVAENDAGSGGNMILQFLVKVSTIACMTPARPHQSECLA